MIDGELWNRKTSFGWIQDVAHSRDSHATGASPVTHCELRSQGSSSQGFSSLEPRQASTPRASCFVYPLHPLQNLPKPYAHTFRVAAAALSQMVHSAFPLL